MGLNRASISRSAFMGRRATASPVVASKSTVRMQQLPVFTNAMADFKAEYPDFAKRGWGATVKAEVRCGGRWWTVSGVGLARCLSILDSHFVLTESHFGDEAHGEHVDIGIASEILPQQPAWSELWQILTRSASYLLHSLLRFDCLPLVLSSLPVHARSAGTDAT